MGFKVIEKAISDLEEKTGVGREIELICIKRGFVGADMQEIKPPCPVWEDENRCIRYQEFQKNPVVNGGLAVFVWDCEGCHGL